MAVANSRSNGIQRFTKSKMKSVVLNLVKTFESHLIYKGFTPEKLAHLSYFFAFKLVDWKKERYTVFEVLD